MFCEQCGQEFEENEVGFITQYGHTLHEYCVDDYLDDIKDSFEPFIYNKESCEDM